MAVFDQFLFLRRYQEFKGRYGLDSKMLSVLLKVPLGTLRKIESGQRFPNWITLLNICDGFGTSVDYMLGRTDDPHAAYAFRYISTRQEFKRHVCKAPSKFRFCSNQVPMRCVPTSQT